MTCNNYGSFNGPSKMNLQKLDLLMPFVKTDGGDVCMNK